MTSYKTQYRIIKKGMLYADMENNYEELSRKTGIPETTLREYLKDSVGFDKIPRGRLRDICNAIKLDDTERAVLLR